MESLQEFFEHWEKQSSLQVPIGEVNTFKINTIKQRKYSLDTEKLIRNSKERAASIKASRYRARQAKENVNTENEKRKASKSKSNKRSNSTSSKKSNNNIHDKIPVKSDEFILIKSDDYEEAVPPVQKKSKPSLKTKRGFKTKRSSINSGMNKDIKLANQRASKKSSPKRKSKNNSTVKLK